MGRLTGDRKQNGRQGTRLARLDGANRPKRSFTPDLDPTSSTRTSAGKRRRATYLRVDPTRLGSECQGPSSTGPRLTGVVVVLRSPGPGGQSAGRVVSADVRPVRPQTIRAGSPHTCGASSVDSTLPREVNHVPGLVSETESTEGHDKAPVQARNSGRDRRGRVGGRRPRPDRWGWGCDSPGWGSEEHLVPDRGPRQRPRVRLVWSEDNGTEDPVSSLCPSPPVRVGQSSLGEGLRGL